MHYICPICKSDQLSISESAYECRNCKKKYKFIEDIPDFRIYPFQYSENEEVEASVLLDNFYELDYINLYKLRQSFFVDKNKTEVDLKKVRELHESGLRGLVDYHMDHSDIFSTNMTRFRHIIGNRILHGEETALELGCGRGTQISDMLGMRALPVF